MNICIALLTGNSVQNFARGLVVEINEKYHTGIIASLLPQHISLKTTFHAGHIEDIEKYFDLLAKETKPFPIKITGIDLIQIGNDAADSGIIWLDIEENLQLRGLHNKLNHDLASRFRILPSGPDGVQFHFYSTLLYGGPTFNEYRKIYDQVETKKFEMECKPTEIALFYSPGQAIIPGTFITYKILPLGE